MTSVYKPSKIELYEAIGSALGDGKTRLEMRLAVKTENPSWRMPSQRKMTKYTKRVVKATSQGISPSAIPVDDASVSTRSSFSVRARNFVKGKGSSAAGGNGEASEGKQRKLFGFRHKASKSSADAPASISIPGMKGAVVDYSSVPPLLEDTDQGTAEITTADSTDTLPEDMLDGAQATVYADENHGEGDNQCCSFLFVGKAR